MPSLLAVCPVPLWPASNGYSLRVVHLLPELASTWEVSLVAAASPPGADQTDTLPLHEYVPVPLGGRIATMPWQLDTETLRTAVHALLRRHRPDAALLWSGSEFLAIDDPAFPPAVGDRIDCAALAGWRNAKSQPALRDRWHALQAAWQAAWYERKAVRALDATTVVGSEDARVMRAISGRRTVHPVPTGVDTSIPPAPEGPRPAVIFTGVMSYQPNVDAALYFANAVWPRVRAAVPDARFLVAGREPSPAVQALAQLPGVEIRADVPAMGPVLDEAWIAVAPMRSGSGIKNKVLEAWARERPVVMTRLAVNGLAMDDRMGALVADAPSTMADLVAALLTDEHQRRYWGGLGRELVLRHHTWRQAADRISALLSAASNAATPGAPREDRSPLMAASPS